MKVQLFKRVAEAGDWVVNLLQSAEALYEDEDYQGLFSVSFSSLFLFMTML